MAIPRALPASPLYLLMPLILMLVISCTTVAGETSEPIGRTPQQDQVESAAGDGETGSTPGAANELSLRQQRLVESAQELLASQNFVVGDQRYSYDCTGTILAIYAMAGIHVVDLFPRYSGNGVNRLYSIARDQDLLYHSNAPQPGDLIFWDNTYDKNGDKQWNDGLTHVGIVLSVSESGIIDYVHHHYTQGVVRARMSLVNPEIHLGADGVIVNSPMRMRSHRYLNPDEWLASHLYRELGALYAVDL
jgi:hypothetical protein